jgi:hypothetical protein
MNASISTSFLKDGIFIVSVLVFNTSSSIFKKCIFPVISDPLIDSVYLPSGLIKELNFYFNEFESFSLSHWNLLKYETINEAFANEDFPNLFMSEKQQNENLFCLNNYFDKVIQIFSKYSMQINSCEKLLEYYLDNHTV